MDILEKLDEKDKKGSKEGLSIICSTKKNMTICWNKGSISPYNKNITHLNTHKLDAGRVRHSNIGTELVGRFLENDIKIESIIEINGISSKSPFNMLTLTDVPDIPITK